MLFLVFNCVCRRCSAYFPKSKCKKYINITNNRVADILIAKAISRDKFVEKYDYNKMSVIGIIPYIFPWNTKLMYINTGNNKRAYFGQ